MATKTKAAKKPAAKKTPAKKRSHTKKPETTFAQHQALDTLKADAEHYGADDITIKHDKERVIFTATGRRWVIDPQGHVTT